MRIAVLSDVHANLPALDAVLAAIGSVDAVWHLGDVVGYGPYPDEVIARLAELHAVGVRGNHDSAAVDGTGVEWFNPDARRAIEWTGTRMTSESRAWLAALPEQLEIGGASLVHASPRDPVWEYITSAPVAKANLDAFGTPYLFHGHTHVPVAFRDHSGHIETIRPTAGKSVHLDTHRTLINPGGVGQPRDGDPRASAAVYDVDAATVTWLRVPYPIGVVQAAMRRAGLPERLAVRLDVGL